MDLWYVTRAVQYQGVVELEADLKAASASSLVLTSLSQTIRQSKLLGETGFERAMTSEGRTLPAQLRGLPAGSEMTENHFHCQSGTMAGEKLFSFIVLKMPGRLISTAESFQPGKRTQMSKQTRNTSDIPFCIMGLLFQALLWYT